MFLLDGGVEVMFKFIASTFAFLAAVSFFVIFSHASAMESEGMQTAEISIESINSADHPTLATVRVSSINYKQVAPATTECGATLNEGAVQNIFHVNY